MANLFSNLPVPVADGVGASVAVSAMGQVKTVVVGGGLAGPTLTVEFSLDNASWHPVKSFSKPGEKTVSLAAGWMRVRVSGFLAGTGMVLTANVDVGSNDDGTQILQLPATAGDGTGAAVDVSALGTFNTIGIAGTLTAGTVHIEISEDNTAWLEIESYTRTGYFSVEVVAQYMRVRRDGGSSGTPVVYVAAVNDPLTISNSFDPERTVVVAKDGGDATGISAGIALASALVPAPDAANPALVWVFPGVYSEAPFTVPTGVSLIAAGEGSAEIDASTTTAALVSGADGAYFEGFSVCGANGVGGIGVQMAVAGGFVVRRISVRDCETAYLSTGAGARLVVTDITCVRTPGTVLTTAFRAAASGLILGSALQAVGVSAAHIGSGLIADNSTGSVVYSVTLSYCDDGLSVVNGGEFSAHGGHIEHSVNALYVQAGGANSILDIIGIHVHSSTTYDIYVASATGVLRQLACQVRSDRAFGTPGAQILSYTMSDEPGDEGHHMLGGLKVGSEFFASESSFGGGDDNNRTMVVQSNTNGEAGAWADHTTAAKSASGSTWTVFPGLVANNCCYFGGLWKFPNLRLNCTTSMVLGAGDIVVWEFWNGAAWTAFDVMAADFGSPHAAYGDAFLARVNTENIRFNTSVMGAWATKALNGSTLYWVRARISAGPITTAPVCEQCMLGTDRAKFGTDGVPECFGAACVQKNLIWHKELLTPFTGGATPGANNQALTNNITLQSTRNVLANNQLEGLGGLFTMPEGLDTSRDVTLRWLYILKAAGTGTAVEFQGHFGQLEVGDVIPVGDTAWNNIINVNALVTDELAQAEASFDVSDLVPGEFLTFSLFRDAQAGNLDDTFANSVELVAVEVLGWFWR